MVAAPIGPPLANGNRVLMIHDRADLPQYTRGLSRLMASCMDENRRDFSFPWISTFMIAADLYYEHVLANQIGLRLGGDQNGDRQVHPPVPNSRMVLFLITHPTDHNTAVASLEALVEVNSATHNAHVSNLMVATDYRTQGLGYTLLNAARIYVQRRWGTRYIQADAQAGQPAYRLYRLMGFGERSTFLVAGRPRSLLEYQYD